MPFDVARKVVDVHDIHKYVVSSMGVISCPPFSFWCGRQVVTCCLSLVSCLSRVLLLLLL